MRDYGSALAELQARFPVGATVEMYHGRMGTVVGEYMVSDDGDYVRVEFLFAGKMTQQWLATVGISLVKDVRDQEL